MKVYVDGKQTTIGSLDAYDTLNTLMDGSPNDSTQFTYSKDGTTFYCAAKIEYGQTVGYIPTELVYAGDLSAKPGETLTSVLDKIKTMLGNYEYFYDVEGRFIFQQKKNYLNTSFSGLVDREEDTSPWADPNLTKLQYSFAGNNLLTSFNNTPNLSNLKNDITVWGQMKSQVTGQEYPIYIG